MKTIDDVKVDHPQFWQTLDTTADGVPLIVVCFKVGYYEEIPKQVQDAYLKIKEAITLLQKERELIAFNHGNLVLYAPQKTLINPSITQEMIDGFVKAAQTAFPEYNLESHWENGTNGVVGYSVRMKNN